MGHLRPVEWAFQHDVCQQEVRFRLILQDLVQVLAVTVDDSTTHGFQHGLQHGTEGIVILDQQDDALRNVARRRILAFQDSGGFVGGGE